MPWHSLMVLCALAMASGCTGVSRLVNSSHSATDELQGVEHFVEDGYVLVRGTAVLRGRLLWQNGRLYVLARFEHDGGCDTVKEELGTSVARVLILNRSGAKYDMLFREGPSGRKLIMLRLLERGRGRTTTDEDEKEWELDWW